MSIHLLLEMATDLHGDRVALGSSTRGVTYRELQGLAAGGAGLLRESGALNVVFLGMNGPCFPVLLFASAAAGLPMTPLNYRLSAEQIAELLLQVDRPYVVADAAYLDLVVAPQVVATVSTETWLEQARQNTAGIAAASDSDAEAVVLFTSGTTSTPKGVVVRHSNLMSYVLQTVELGSAAEGDAALVSVPPYHIAGLGAVLSNVYAGRRIVYLPVFDPAGWLNTVRDEGITTAMVVPTMLARVVEHLGGQPSELPQLGTLAYGGARMPLPVLMRALAAFPQVGFVNAYGLTETSSTLAVLGPEDHRLAITSEDAQVRARLGSVGRAVPGVELLIRDPDGVALPAGSPGALWVRGGQVSGEYRGTGSVLDGDGWFPTGDEAYLDADCYLFVLGRQDDTIIRGGENIAPAEVEAALHQHPDILDVGVFGEPDDEWGERIIAAVVVREGSLLTSGQVRDFARARLRGSRTPDVVFLVQELPYTATGKLLRKDLSRLVLSP